jgi:hypothetical protein
MALCVKDLKATLTLDGLQDLIALRGGEGTDDQEVDSERPRHKLKLSESVLGQVAHRASASR